MILVVDDDPDIARFVEVNLRSAGFDVAVATDGEEALRRAEEIRPDLVLLDVMMPRVDGFEVAQRLRRNTRTANTCIIMLTAKAQSSDKVLGLTAGADDYIIKPFDPIELLARVKTTLRRARDNRNLSPLTGLPGNIRIEDEVQRRVEENVEFALLNCDMDNFKAYNAPDAERGFIEVEDRQGNPQNFPVVSISIGISTTSTRKFTHYGEAIAVAAEMKQVAKRAKGSAYALDRRHAVGG